MEEGMAVLRTMMGEAVDEMLEEGVPSEFTEFLDTLDDTSQNITAHVIEAIWGGKSARFAVKAFEMKGQVQADLAKNLTRRTLALTLESMLEDAEKETEEVEE